MFYYPANIRILVFFLLILTILEILEIEVSIIPRLLDILEI